MSIEAKVLGGVAVTPELIAELFWEMASDEMADFFAELDRTAGSALCTQMAWTVGVMAGRSDKGDYRAQNGFQTMLAHAQEYHDGAASHRACNAHIDIDRMVRGVKQELGGTLLAGVRS